MAVLVAAFIGSCQEKEPAKDLTQYVDPFIGTDAHGHTFPGATTPFGMIQLSPSNDYKGWDWSSGYHYSDSVLKGFAHNHISGPGLSGLGDILLMPSMSPQTDAGTEEDPSTGYRATFAHRREKANPGYYQVYLTDEQINVELTAMSRTGIHRYAYDQDGAKYVIIDPTHGVGEFAYETAIDVISENQVAGYKRSKSGTAGDRTVYFLATFSQPFSKVGITREGMPVSSNKESGLDVKAFVEFDTTSSSTIEVQVTLSHASQDGASKNWNSEAKGVTFDEAHATAKSTWNKVLNKIVVESSDPSKLRTFYTGMYHAFIAPNLISDVDGQYYADGKVRSSEIPQYSNYSTWDTYRALHPLLTIIEQKKSAEFVNSMVSRHADEGLVLPQWEAMGYDNLCMIGYNMASPIADAVLKDIPGIDHERAYQAVKNAAFDKSKDSQNYDVGGMEGYIKYGYVTGEVGSSVSKTTEQNYYDWALGRMAAKLGKMEDANMFDQRSKGWRNLFDPSTGYLIPRMANGEFVSMDTTTWKDLIRNYVSGNIWAYSAYTPHDMKGVMQLHGSREAYLEWLDGVFNNTYEMEGAQHVDISGFIGKYGHGDEPGHQMPYLYTIAGQPWKAQKYVNEVITTMYWDRPDGLVNNEDLGQMSAWYIFSTLGFYPLAPGDLAYQLGAPYHDKATINLENGNSFTVLAEDLTDDNIYVQSVKLNGKAYNKTFIRHGDILQGGTLEFIMGPEPNKDWGTDPASGLLGDFEDQMSPNVPVTAVSAPFDPESDSYFEASNTVELKTRTEGATIFYTLDGSTPTTSNTQYDRPIKLTNDATIKAISVKEGLNPSIVFEKKYFKSFLLALPNGYPKISMPDMETQYGLSDGSMMFDQLLGSESYSDGRWTGSKSDFELVVDLGEKRSVNKVSIGALTDTGVWIFPPDQIGIMGSANRKNWKSLGQMDIRELEGDKKEVVRYEFDLEENQSRYLRITIKNYGEAPVWHGAGKGQQMWLFVDEIMLK